MNDSKFNMAKLISLVLASVGGLSIGSTAIAQEQESSLLEEIVVTAQKREQSLENIPMSITVLTGNMLEKVNATSFEDMVSLIPGFSITGSTPGVTRITIRGINTGGVASTVGVYVGDVPFGSSSGLANGAVLSGDFDTFDLARVEILRGPQGTLYGASSLGGVLKYVPNQPSTEGFETRVKGGFETVKNGDMGWSTTGVFNAPLGENFAVRASGFYRKYGGFIDSIGNNPIASLTEPGVNVIEGTQVDDDLNSTKSYGGRVSALFTPSENLSINLMALLQDIKSNAPDEIDADPVSFRPVSSKPVQSRYQDAYNDISYRIYSATIDWDFEVASLQSVTSWGNFKQDFQVDAALATSLTGGFPLSSYLSFAFGTPLSAVLPQETKTDKFTQEVRLLSPENDNFEWLAGVYYTKEDSGIDQLIVAVEPGTETPAAGFPTLAVANVISDYKEIAAFANATWYVTPDFEISFGARVSNNDQKAKQVTDGPLAGGVLTEINGKSSETPFTWSVSPRYQFGDNTSVYARVATGFRPGGPNILPPGAPEGTPASYDSDKLTNYEVGYKTTSSDGQYSLDFSAFYLDWKDIQLFAVVNGFGVNANGGKAVSKGFEFSAGFNPVDGLNLSVNGAYTKSKLTEDTDPVVGGLDGDPLPYVPKFSFGISADYEWTVGANSMAYFGGTFGHTGKRPLGLSTRDAGGDQLEISSFSTIDLRAGIETGRWALEIYAKNLTDQLGISSFDNTDSPTTGWANMGIMRPRTFGVSVGTSF